MARLTSTHFGIFVIFAAVYAAGTLGLGRPEIAGVAVKVGEIAVPLVGLFGMPAVIGLVFGQFVANSASPLGPMDMLSPLVSLVGLLILWRFKRLVIAGSLVYVAVTTPWLAYLLANARGVGLGEVLGPAFASQLAAILIGYVIYEALRRLAPFREEKPIAEQAVAAEGG